MKLRHSHSRPAPSTTLFEPLEGRQLCSSAPGTLDPSFGTGGKQVLNFPGGGLGIAADTVVQPDGKTVVVGRVDFKTSSGSKVHRFGVARFNFNGTLDKTFGPDHNGTVTFGMGNKNNDSATAVALQPDGGIVVAGSAQMDGFFSDHSEFAVARLLSNGTLDKAFNGSGKRLIQVKDDSFANDVAIQQDGKIVVVGGDFNGGGIFTLDDSDFAIARLNANGSLDKTFAGGGKRIIPLGEMESATAVAIDTNGLPNTNPNFGKIVLAGSLSKFGTRQDYALVRLNANGALDNTFDGNGKLAAKFAGYSQAFVNGVVIQNTGGIVVSGHAAGGNFRGETPITLARHKGDGSIDKSFGADGNGSAYMNLGGDDRGGNLIINADNKLVVGGTSDGRFALAGFTRDGRIDFSFGVAGRIKTDFGTAGAVRIARGPGRRITATGGDLFKTARFFDSGANTVFLSDIKPDVSEGAPNNTTSFVVVRSESLPVSTRVFFNLSGTANNNVDFTTNLKRVIQLPPIIDIATGKVTLAPAAPGNAFIDIPAGKTFVAVTMTTIDDNVVEGSETATFTIAPNNAYNLSAPSSVTINVQDNDSSGGPTIRSVVRSANPSRNLFSDERIDKQSDDATIWN
jgi:uncharacterized delta-60 repeat protein